MSERSLIHKDKLKEFEAFLFVYLDFKIEKPRHIEVSRVSNFEGVVTFTKRKGSDHITTWGRGTELAKAFIKYQKEQSNAKDLLPANTAGSDERRSNSVR